MVIITLEGCGWVLGVRGWSLGKLWMGFQWMGELKRFVRSVDGPEPLFCRHLVFWGRVSSA